MATLCSAGPIALNTPAGLAPGDTFRFVFVSSDATTAESSDINDYNSFVNSEADGATYQGSTVAWDAILSTPTMSAIGNIGSSLSDGGIFLVDGTEVAASDTASGLWSGDLQNALDEGINGNQIVGFMWSGTSPDGTSSSNPAGGTFTSAAYAGFDTSWWIDYDEYDDGHTDYGSVNQLYGISEVLTVTPEPSSAIFLSISLIALVFGARIRRVPDSGSASPQEH